MENKFKILVNNKVSELYNAHYYVCPESWVKPEDNSEFFFFECKEGQHLSFDFNEYFNNEKDIAIMMSIEGVNPLTGQEQTDFTLKKYKKCPIHNASFLENNFCPKCKYSWTSQNYIATSSAPKGKLDLKGYRLPNNKVRKFKIIKDSEKSVSDQILKKNKYRYSIKIALFESRFTKEAKNDLDVDLEKSGVYWRLYQPSDFPSDSSCWPQIGENGTDIRYWQSYDTVSLSSNDLNTNLNNFYVSINNANDNNSFKNQRFESARILDLEDDDVFRELSTQYSLEENPLYIGAGRKIQQEFYEDENDLIYWNEKPSSIVYLNFSDSEVINKILKTKYEEINEGFLANVQK